MFSCFTLLAILQFCFFLNHRDITTSHEGRVASSAREMVADGDWIVPHNNGRPRILKPPLPYWSAAALWKLAGSTDGWLARLPAALCGALAVLLVADLGRRVLGRGGGIVAGLVWISTWFIVTEYRKAMADPYLAFFTLLSVWSWVVAHPPATPTQSTSRISEPTPRAAFVLLSYLSAALGTLAKGPIILVHLALALIPYHGLDRRRRRPYSNPLIHALGVALFLAVAAPWPAMIALRIPHAVRVWIAEMHADQATSGDTSSPVWAYLASLPLTSAPWTVVGIVGILATLIAKRHQRRHRRALWPLTWLAATVVAFSILPMKKNAYLLPTMPAQTLVIAAPVVSNMRTRRHNTGDRLLFAGHAIAAAAAMCAVLGIVLANAPVSLEPPGPLLASAAIGIFLLVGAKSLSPRLISMRTFALTALAFALAVHGYESWIWPELDNRRSDRRFAENVNSIAGDAPLCLIGSGLREDVLFYLGRTIPVYRVPERLPADYRGYAIATVDAMAAHPPADVVARSANRPGSADDSLVLLRIPADPAVQNQPPER
jgi:4-amino-4-deoxy-L-arabinose transferase-like glycosyltransferase